MPNTLPHGWPMVVQSECQRRQIIAQALVNHRQDTCIVQHRKHGGVGNRHANLLPAISVGHRWGIGRTYGTRVSVYAARRYAGYCSLAGIK